MEAHTDHQASGQVLMPGLGGDERRFVLGRRTGGIMTVPDKISLHLGWIDAFTIRRRFQGRAEHAGPLSVEFDQLLGNGMPLDRKSTRLNSSHLGISYAVFCLKK